MRYLLGCELLKGRQDNRLPVQKKKKSAVIIVYFYSYSSLLIVQTLLAESFA